MEGVIDNLGELLLRGHWRLEWFVGWLRIPCQMTRTVFRDLNPRVVYLPEMPSAVSKATVRALLRSIEAARRKSGVSQELLAELSGVNLGVISRAANQKRIPGLASILDMGSALKLDVPALLGNAMRDAVDGSGAATGGDPE